MTFIPDTNVSVEISIKTEDGSVTYHVLVPKKNVSNEQHCRSVIGSGLELVFALLDAAFQKVEKEQ